MSKIHESLKGGYYPIKVEDCPMPSTEHSMRRTAGKSSRGARTEPRPVKRKKSWKFVPKDRVLDFFVNPIEFLIFDSRYSEVEELAELLRPAFTAKLHKPSKIVAEKVLLLYNSYSEAGQIIQLLDGADFECLGANNQQRELLAEIITSLSEEVLIDAKSQSAKNLKLLRKLQDDFANFQAANGAWELSDATQAALAGIFGEDNLTAELSSYLRSILPEPSKSEKKGSWTGRLTQKQDAPTLPVVAPEKWVDRDKSREETIPQFLERVWGDWLVSAPEEQKLRRGRLSELDMGLYGALNRWEKRGNQLPSRLQFGSGWVTTPAEADDFLKGNRPENHKDFVRVASKVRRDQDRSK